jgi:hypothetical protein
MKLNTFTAAIRRYGYTPAGYWSAIVAFPPAALFIACKIPGLSWYSRALRCALPIVLITVGPAIIAAIARVIYQLFK